MKNFCTFVCTGTRPGTNVLPVLIRTALLLVVLPAMLAAVTPTFTVTTNGDGAGSVSGSSPSFSATTLRAALNYINLNKGSLPTTIINLPSGITITLTSELPVAPDGGQTITINGNGSTIDGVNAYRCLNIDYNAIGNTNVTVNNLTLTRGAAPNDTFGGGAILDGTGYETPVDQLTLSGCTISNSKCVYSGGGGGGVAMWGGPLTLTNCTFSGNTTSNSRGGAINYAAAGPGTITISGCTFSGNSTTASSGISQMAYGGAISFMPTSNITCTISNTSFSNNTAATYVSGDESNGGAIYWNGATSLSITRCSFTGNQASAGASGTGTGGALCLITGGSYSFSISYSRFSGNTAKTHGNAIYYNNGSSLSAANNWWGANSAPGASDVYQAGTGTVTTSPYLLLRCSPARSTIITNDTTLLRADILGLSTGGSTAAGNLTGLPTFNATFDNASGGTLSLQTNFVNGAATAVFTAGSSAGTGSAQVTADNQTVTVSPTITIAQNNVTFSDGSAYTPPAPVPNTTDNPIGRFQLTPVASGAVLSSVTVGFSGAPANVAGVKLYKNSSSSFGGAVQIGTTQTFGASVTFSSLSSAIATGGTYYFVALDLGASTGTTMASIANNAALTLTSGVLSGTISNAQLASGEVVLPVQAVDFNAQSTPGAVTLSWKTVSEIDNAGFTILRAEPLTGVYTVIASFTGDERLRGLGTSSVGRNYSCTDNTVVCGKEYKYRIQSVATNGSTRDLTALSVMVEMPATYALHQNYPNPFNPATTIRFELPAADGPRMVTLAVYDIAGREIAILVNEMKDAGAYTVTFDGSNIPSGIYFYRLQAGTYTQTRKLVLLR